jgi:hypothetical protein
MANDNDGSSNRGDPAIGAAAVSEAKIPDPVPSKPATEADLDKVEKRLSGFERSTLRWTRASFGVVLATAVFICLQWLEMRSGGKDTHDLAVAAKSQAENTAKQIPKLDASIAQASRLAAATEQANQNVLDADRPWIGIAIEVTNFEADQTPTKTLTLVNSGKRPAMITSLKADGDYAKAMSETPQYRGGTSVKRQFLVPGTVYVSKVNLFRGGVLKSDALSILNSKTTSFFSYAAVEYIDVRTGKHHFTHACKQYVPASPSEGNSAGFFGCEAYNSGD